jgi:RNA polymerase sigma-70 factor, ECF subfamily
MSQPMSQSIPEPPSDAELMVRVREGDREAFAELVDRHKDAVVAYLARLTADPDRAEDLGQETFLRLFRAAGAYSEQGYLRAYLLRIGTNLVRSEERRARRLRLLAPFLARETGAAREDNVEPAAVTGLLSRELHREVTAAVARLPLRYRVALVLHEIEGWTYLDIARELGCREGTVKSRVHRGRAQLKKRLEPYWKGNGNGNRNGDAAWKNNGKTNG